MTNQHEVLKKCILRANCFDLIIFIRIFAIKLYDFALFYFLLAKSNEVGASCSNLSLSGEGERKIQ